MKKPLTSDGLIWVGVDFDDVIASNSGYPDYILSGPMAGAKSALEAISAKGFKIIIYTARPWSQHIVIEDWLNTWMIPFKRIECGKILLRWMIDDRNIPFDPKNPIESWKAVLDSVV